MKVLVDIGHPGHVHLFRPVALQMQKEGHDFLFTCREKEFEVELLKVAGLKHRSMGPKYRSILGKVWGVFEFGFKIWRIGKKFKPDILLSHGSIYAAHASFVLRVPHISMEDTGNMEQVNLYLRFTDIVLTSTAFHRDLGPKQIRYPSYHELAYLHPNHFSAQSNFLDKFTLDRNKKTVLLRFVSWSASHDINQEGLSLEIKRKLIDRLKCNYNIFISSESALANEFEEYELKIAPANIHHLLSAVDLFIGEGATMASECAVLGTPAIYVNTITAGTISDQQKYGLLKHIDNSINLEEILFSSIKEFENSNTLKARRKMISEKFDLTAFLKWFLLNYPESIGIWNRGERSLEDFQ